MAKIMNLKGLGNFKFVRTLDGCDYPRIFVCEDQRANMFLFAEIDFDDESEEWVAIHIDTETYDKLLFNKITIQKAFINANVDKYYIIKHVYIDDRYEYATQDFMPEDVISQEEFFVGIDILKENKILQESNIKASKESNFPILDFHFNPYTNNHGLSANFLVSVLENVKNIFGNITKTRKDNLLVELVPGSFVLRFKSNITDSIISKDSPSNAFKIIKKIVSSNLPEDLINEMRDHPNIFKKSADLINVLARENKHFDVIYGDYSENEKGISNVSPDTIKFLNERMKNTTITVKEQKTIIGTLLGYDIKRKTFTFKEINGECMKGKLGKDFDLIKTLEIPTNYEANITITDMHDIENDKHKYAYELLHLRALEE